MKYVGVVEFSKTKKRAVDQHSFLEPILILSTQSFEGGLPGHPVFSLGTGSEHGHARQTGPTHASRAADVLDVPAEGLPPKPRASGVECCVECTLLGMAAPALLF